MMYMSEFFQEKLRLPVTYLNTFGAVSIGEGVDKELLQSMAPMCQELIGSALHSITHCPINISLLPRSIRKQYELNVRKPYFYASAGVLIVCLLLFGFGVDQLLRREQGRVVKAQSEVSKISQIAREIDDLNGKCSAAESRFNDFKRVFEARSGVSKDSYFRVLAELQRLIPDQMWLVSLEPSDVLPPEPKKALVKGPEEDMGGGEEQTQTNALDPNRDQREIKYIILKGYAINVKNTLAPAAGSNAPDYLRQFRDALKTSEVFKEESRLYTNNSSGNLNGFDIVLELKDTLRK